MIVQMIAHAKVHTRLKTNVIVNIVKKRNKRNIAVRKKNIKNTNIVAINIISVTKKNHAQTLVMRKGL
jgi:hypothetical protein